MDCPRYTLEKTISDCDATKRDIPSFIESKLSYPSYGPRRLIDDQTKPKRLFEDDSESSDEPELVQVYLRLRPCKGDSDLYQVKSDRCLITSLDSATAGHGRRTQHNVSKMYKFSHIFGPNATQKQIFEHVVKDNLKKLSEGHSFTLLTYGASGSGKTYTLMGTVAAPGLVPRALEYVFKLVDAAQEPGYKPLDGGAEKLSFSRQELEMKFVKNLRQVSAPLRDKYRRMSVRLTKEMSTLDLSNRTQYYVWVSFVEIYNEAVYDLLVPSDRRKTSKLRIREDATGHVYVKGATQAFVRSGEEAYDVMVAGKHNLQVAATGVHASSSRSHCIFTITLLAHSDSCVRVSCVRLCDLAGAERAGRTNNRGARMQESRAINSSLHVLEKCLHALRRNQRAQLDANLVPYRESKLTRLLGGGLSGARGEAVSMVVTVNPHPDDMHETKHVLQLANVARDIHVNNTIEEQTWSEHNSQNSTVCSSAEVMQLRAENERLHFELAQSHAQCKRLVTDAEEHRQQAATTMKQLVSEAKDFTSQYYKSMLANMEQRHMSEMRELLEELEECKSKLQAAGISTVTTRDKPKLMSDQFSRSSSIIEEDELSEQLANLSTQSQNKTLTDYNSSTVADTNQASVSILSDNFPSDDEANESLEPNFKIQQDLNKSKQPIGDDYLNAEDRLLKVDDEVDKESDDDSDTTLDDDLSASESANVVEDSTSFKTAENSCNTTDGIYDNKEQSKTKSDLNNSDTLACDKHNFNNTKEAPKLNVSSNFAKQIIKVETIEEDDEGNVNSVSAGNNVEINTINTSERALKASTRDSIFDFEAIEKKIKAEMNVSNKVKTPTALSTTINKPHNANSVSVAKNVEKNMIKTSERALKASTRDSISDFEAIEKKIKADMNVSNNVQIPSLSKSINKPHNYFDEILENQQTTKNKHYFHELKSQSVFDNMKNISNKSIQNNEDDPSTNNIMQDNKDKYLPEPRTLTVGNNLEKLVNKHDAHNAIQLLEDKLPSIVKDYEMPKNYDSTRIKILLGETSVLKNTPNKNDSVDIFDELNSPVPVTIKKNNLGTKKHDAEIDEIRSNLARTSIKEINIDFLSKDKTSAIRDIVSEKPLEEQVSEPEAKIVTKSQDPKDVKILETNKSNNTVDDFENIYNDLSQTRATEFDLLVTQELSKTNIDNGIKGIEASTLDIKTSKNHLQHDEKDIQVSDVIIKAKKKDNCVDTINSVESSTQNIQSLKLDSEKGKKITEVKIKEQIQDNSEDNKTSEKSNKETPKPQSSQSETNQSENNAEQNSGQTTKSKYKLRNKNNDLEIEDEEFQKIKEIISKPLTRRNLRLRRRKNENIPNITENVEVSDNAKLKDIVNLQKEFSDVTMNVPVAQKVAKDILSPEKEDDYENVEPTDAAATFGKSVTRSRRKLFTPRAEPLEDSPPDTGNSNERIRVPRPSYHRPRARRKL